MISFSMSVGFSPKTFSVGETKIGCDYADDACLIMGDKTLYIKRHLIRVYEELKAAYLEIPEFNLKSILK